ncbi:hypothetical protein HTZ97_05595 [Desulfuromonas acetoxidans]|uniref:hypothetical protein n=1 Tax=Desulfuromonas acetoxidans TaxID=891 RepID=UPI00058DD2FE|nr:hypothetical protein [Desulfuromonas acetoxidans]NVD23683.1 hypothetical protein [Desulfuromonas acetoxidans]NVE15932.1 hypothetical protein [Desulfuromonas acetoxidans]
MIPEIIIKTENWINQVDAAGPFVSLSILDQLIESAPNPDHPLNHYLQGLRDGRFMFEKLKVRLSDA